MTKPLIQVIDEFLAETGMAATSFGFLAVKNKRLVERLRDGNAVLTTTDERVRQYINNARKRAAA
jgi:hypothetical protein